MESHINTFNFKGDPNVGLYCLATNNYAIVGDQISEEKLKILNDTLKVPIITTKIYGTPFVGIFCAGNSDTLLVPDIIFDNEYKKLEKGLKGIAKIVKFKTNKTALGNNILCNDTKGIIAEEYSNTELKFIEKNLKIKVIQSNISEGVPGSFGALNNLGGAFGQNISESKLNEFEKFFGIDLGIASVSGGSPIISSGIVCNDNGFLISSISTGFETGRLDECLGLIK